MKISDLPDLLPQNIRESYIRFLNASSDKGQAFNEATQFCWGLPSNGHSIMSQGWNDSNIPFGADKLISTVEKVTRKVKVGEDLIPVQVKGTIRKYIEGLDIPGKTIPGKVIPGRVIPGGFETIDIDRAVVVGAMADAGHLLAQGISPVYRRAQRGTRNYHGVDANGNVTIDNNQGRSDMYDTPVAENENGTTQRRYRRYEHHHSIDDRALNTMDANGNPVRQRLDRNGRPQNPEPRTYDDDDFSL